MKFTNVVKKLGIAIIFLTCLGLPLSCSPRQEKISITPIPESSTSSPYPTHTITPISPSTITNYPIATPKLPSVTDGYPIATPDLQSVTANYPILLIKTVTPIPTVLPTIPVITSPKPEIAPTITVSRLNCFVIDELFSKCTDNVLGIEFEIPIVAGAINTTLTDHNVDMSLVEYNFTMGHIYNYKLENYPRSIGGFENLDAIGWGDDFSVPRGGFILFPEFIGCAGANICEEIFPNILLTLYFPNAKQLCDPSPGMTYIAYGAVVLNLPQNPQINVFYFTGPTLVKELNDELINIVVSLDPYHERNCNEETVQQFNSKLDEILTDIEQGTLDETSTQNIELLYHIAESIEFIEQP